MYGIIVFFSLTRFTKIDEAKKQTQAQQMLSEYEISVPKAFQHLSAQKVSWFRFAVSWNLNKIMSSTLFPPLSSIMLEAKIQILPPAVIWRALQDLAWV